MCRSSGLDIIDSYLLLLGKRKLQSLKISYEQFFLFWNKRLPLLSATIQLVPHLKASKLNNCLGRLLEEIQYQKKDCINNTSRCLWWKYTS